ncbi:DUF881 domain-containing protein [Aminipila butyrica]|uniref:DUF881 domain-containing protein n=1 Tax=Aminipila butyrica TaxID=433296 RepID=A0A858BYW3_9FIRM|nr:DUF881 domain-containing protein [Aminipila butyrica]QIB70090.1 DUF881 domain-containing protein [Aminipila butyrica]
MNKRRMWMVFAICTVIGIGLACQMKVSDGQRLYVSPKTVEDYKITINSEKEEVTKLQLMIQEAEEKLASYEQDSQEDGQSDEAFQKNLAADVEKYKMASGLETVRGPGVEVVIDDGTRELFAGEDVNNLLVHDLDILMIINELNRCGAEAVAVNGQRITANTSVYCSGYTVRINGEVYARPFRIKAIGDGKRMAAALVDPDGYGTSLKNWGVQFEVRLKDDITIDALSKEYVYRYMNKLQKEGTN